MGTDNQRVTPRRTSSEVPLAKVVAAGLVAAGALVAAAALTSLLDDSPKAALRDVATASAFVVVYGLIARAIRRRPPAPGAEGTQIVPEWLVGVGLALCVYAAWRGSHGWSRALGDLAINVSMFGVCLVILVRRSSRSADVEPR